MLKLYVESTMTPTPTPRKTMINGGEIYILTNYQIGTRYNDFNQLSPFIEVYDIPVTRIQKDDIIIRDWQYGHRPNTGYRPYKVVAVTENNSIKIFDGHRTYSVCTDPIISKDTTWHKLYNEYLKD